MPYHRRIFLKVLPATKTGKRDGCGHPLQQLSYWKYGMFRFTFDARSYLRAGMTRLWAGLVAVLALTLAGCAPGAIPIEEAQIHKATVKPTSYRISEGDKLDVKVFGEPEMSGEVQVDAEGVISLPLVGRMPAAGITAASLRGRIAKQITAKGYVQDPNVTVAILSYEPVNIFGEVRNAGQYTYRPGMTVRDAIALAGGYTYRANKNYVYIQQESGMGEKKLSMGGAKLYVQPGDSLRISERFF